MESIGAFDAKTRLSELLDRAARGESFVITKHGHPVAKLVPGGQEDSERVAGAVERLKGFRGVLRGATIDEVLTDEHAGHRF